MPSIQELSRRASDLLPDARSLMGSIPRVCLVFHRDQNAPYWQVIQQKDALALQFHETKTPERVKNFVENIRQPWGSREIVVFLFRDEDNHQWGSTNGYSLAMVAAEDLEKDLATLVREARVLMDDDENVPRYESVRAAWMLQTGNIVQSW